MVEETGAAVGRPEAGRGVCHLPGQVLDTDAMIAALESVRSGAVLDVYEQRPLPADSPCGRRKT